jgi:hypothetical protein
VVRALMTDTRKKKISVWVRRESTVHEKEWSRQCCCPYLPLPLVLSLHPLLYLVCLMMMMMVQSVGERAHGQETVRTQMF